MKAIGFSRHLPVDDPDCLRDLDLPDPQPGPHDLLVRVQAVSVNPVDTKQRAPRELLGQEAAAAPRVLGWDAAGTVAAAGDAVTLFRPGDRVYYAGDLTRPGCDSELHLVNEFIVGPMPRSLDFAQAAALPLTALTAWEALFERLRVPAQGRGRAGSILIIGGAGGVGSIAIQLAARVAGLRVVATASRPESRHWCRELGAHTVVDHFGDVAAQVRAAGHAWVDHVLVLNAIDRHFAAACEIVAPQGGICSIVANAQPLDAAAMALLRKKSGSLSWEMMFTRSGYATPDRIEQHHILSRVAALIDQGVLRTTAAEVLAPINAAQLRRAHLLLEQGRAIGKVVLHGFSA